MTVTGSKKAATTMGMLSECFEENVVVRPVADPEREHLRVSPHPLQEAEPLDDPMVEIDEVRLGQLVDVEPDHGAAGPGTGHRRHSCVGLRGQCRPVRARSTRPLS